MYNDLFENAVQAAVWPGWIKNLQMEESECDFDRFWKGKVKDAGGK